MRDINYRLLIHDEAEADLDLLYEEDPDAIAEIVAVLEEISTDQSLLFALTDHGYRHQVDPEFNVQKFLEYWNKGENIWRLRCLNRDSGAPMYRVLYAYIPKTRTFHVLGITHRNFGYEPGHEFTQRIIRAYRDLS